MVVVLDADHLGPRLTSVADAWRDHPSLPGLVALGASPVARVQATAARVVLVEPAAPTAQLVSAIKEAARLRHASGMRWTILRGALGLPPPADEPATWGPTLVAARSVDIEIPKAALRWHAVHYATPTARMQDLRDER